jgi:Protein of unknown function (DUF1203)
VQGGNPAREVLFGARTGSAEVVPCGIDCRQQEAIMNYRITGLSPAPFRHLYGLSDTDLARHGAKRYTAHESPGFPDRIELRDAKVGETLILLNHEHQPAASPYKSRHAIFVLEGAEQTFDRLNEVPGVMRVPGRLLSFRGFDRDHMMIEADVITCVDVEATIARFFANSQIDYIHVHNAK